MNIACVLVSWRPDEPAGMERAVAGLVAGLRALGHQAFVITAVPQPWHSQAIQLASLPLHLPSDDQALRRTIERSRPQLDNELTAILRRHDVDAVYYVDALWGLGRVAVTDHPARRLLGMHVVGHDTDLAAALDGKPDAVITPSRHVHHEAQARGYDTRAWRVVPNSLLVAEPPTPNPCQRELLRRSGPVRVVARLGPEKGITQLLDDLDGFDRDVDIALAAASFEPDPGSQGELANRCHAMAAAHPHVHLHPALAWADVPRWFADAAVAIVPSIQETFGLVALEALSVGTPVIAHAVGNLPDLIGDAGTLVPAECGGRGLCAATRELLGDALRYERASAGAHARARSYRPDLIAHHWLETVLT